MTAVLVPTSSEAEWLAARRQGITASEIAILMGLSPYSSPYALHHRKTGNLPEQDDDMAMAIGRHFENFVAEQFGQRHPEFGTEGDGRTLYAHPDRPWQMATPDRLIYECEPGACMCCISQVPLGTHLPGCRRDEPVAVLECKTDGGFDGWGDDGTDEIPVHYRCQVLWQMDVLGVSTGFVACLFMSRRQLRVYELTLDSQAEDDLDIMRNEADAFLARLHANIPPGVDWRPATSAALKRLYPGVEDRSVVIPMKLASQYRAACKAVKAAEQRKELAVNRIRERLGTANRATDANGQPLLGRQVYDVKEHVRRASHVDKLVPVKPKEPKP